MLEVHDPSTRDGDRRLRHHEDVAEAAVEPDGHIACQLEVLALVIADRDPLSVVEDDIGGLQHGIGEQPDPDRLLAGTLVLELRHPLQLTHGGSALEQPCHLGVLDHVALDEQGAPIGVEPGGQQVERGVVGPAPQFGRVDVERQGVEVDHAVERIMGPLVLHPVADGPQVVAEMEVAAGLDSGEHTCHKGVIVRPGCPGPVPGRR